MANKLEEARKIINEVDAQMAELFVRRMRAAELVYEHKKEFGLPILDQKREDAVIEKNSAQIEDEVLKGHYIDFLKHTMAISRAYQYRMQSGLRVAYSGVEGNFAHIAAGKIFPESSRVPHRDFQAAYDSVVDGESEVAVLPIENSCAGDVGQTLDLIFSGPLFINGIYELRNAEEAVTRFAVFSRAQAISPGLTSSVLMFTVKNEAGSPADAIRIIGEYGYNIAVLRSCPPEKHSRQACFYVEIDGRLETENGANMLQELGRVCDRLKVLGTFAPHTEI